MAFDWKGFFEKQETVVTKISDGGDGVLQVDWLRMENLYQAFKQRLLEETTATEIPEGNRVR